MLISRLLLILLLALPVFVYGAESATPVTIDLTQSLIGFTALGIFFVAYLLVVLEEYTALSKSKPVVVAAGLIWILLAWAYGQHGLESSVESLARQNLLEYAELMMFLLVAMTYVNAMEERQVFEWLRVWLVKRRFSMRTIFWLTGLLAFFISPIADNLTTALVMCAVVLAVAGSNTRFVSVSCVNIVVAVNAGGAFSPFGDITTLMVWQNGAVSFWQFFALFLPSLVNWVIPAAIMSLAVKTGPAANTDDEIQLKRGAKTIIFLFLLTIATAVYFHNFLHLPPVLGMFMGLGYLQFYGYYLKRTFSTAYLSRKYNIPQEEIEENTRTGAITPFNVFVNVSRAEWDTLLFFYGVVMCVGGLGQFGYLALTSDLLYNNWGPMVANISVGVISAVVDNIPVMFAVLKMNPDMSLGHWLLVTLTAGVGGSLLSVGSAAGVALMGQSKGAYTFVGHLVWAPVIAIGYVCSVAAHIWLNAALF
jgi:NhaD family Na+/H+ antiporter